jgi:pimeloyl-ACP methyl ester carboxylesterase
MLASEAFVAPGCWHYARIDGVGHWMAVDAPHELNAILLAFLAVTESQGVRPKL